MKRDIHGIIVQDAKEDPSYQDGGDSAFSTGLMAFGGSKQDFDLMPLFIQDGKLVRHPFQDVSTGTASHNDPKATSRDQVLAFFSGLSTGPCWSHLEHVRKSCLFYAESWKVNSDFLSPANKFYLYKCAWRKPPLWLIPLAYVNQALDLLVNCFINPSHEQTQSTAINYVFGRRWIGFLHRFHPDLFGNLNEYFGGWRNRQEIADAMIAKVKAVL